MDYFDNDNNNQYNDANVGFSKTSRLNDKTKKAESFCIVGFVFGIVSVVVQCLCCIVPLGLFFSIILLLFAIAGLLLSVLGVKELSDSATDVSMEFGSNNKSGAINNNSDNMKALGIIGIVLSSVGIIFGIIVVALIVFFTTVNGVAFLSKLGGVL